MANKIKVSDIDVSALQGRHMYSVEEAAALLKVGTHKMYSLLLKPERDTKKARRVQRQDGQVPPHPCQGIAAVRRSLNGSGIA